jgi:hypothetical protein
VEAFANGGGIVGNVAADEALESQTPFTILWCGNYGEVTASAKGLAAHGGNKNFGGIAGRVDRPCFITECYNQNKVCGGAFVGGIVGSASGFASGGRTESDGVMESCVNHDLICQSIGECGSVCGDADAEGCAGGIVGASISFGGIFSCTNKMTICANANNAGGIAGKFENCEMQNCTNEGYVSSNASSAGGIVGVVSSTSDAAEPASIVKCGNHGEVEGSGESVGGIAGLISGNVIINGCASFGSVRGNSADGVGGIAGSVCNANCDELGSLGAIKESLVLCPYVKGASNVHKAIGSLKCRLDGLCVKVDDRVQLQRADGTRANAGNAPAFPPLEDSDETQTELDGDIVEDASELAAAFRHNK